MDSLATQPTVETIAEPRPLSTIAPWQRWCELGLVVLIAVAPLTLSAFGSLLHPTSGSGFSSNFRIASRLLHEISSLLLVSYLLNRRGHNLKNLGLTSFHWTDALKGLGLTLGGLFFSAILSLFVHWFSLAFTGHPAEVRDPRVIFAGIPRGGFVIYSFGAAIFEETIVRGYLMSEMIALATPVWLAALASIVLQTSYHVYYGLGGAVAVAGTFIIFGIYFANSRRLLPVILGHLFTDLWATWVNFH